MNKSIKYVVLFIVLILLGSINVKASEKELLLKENPTYKYYKSLSEEEKSTWGYIPNRLFIVNSENYNAFSNNKSKNFKLSIYPTTYNLTNVGGENLAPAIRAQGGLGLCWAFAMNSMLESYLIKHNMGSYNFSENQLDLAATYNGEYGFSLTRDLGDGYNFYNGLFNWLYGYGPVTETTFGYEYFTNYDGKNITLDKYLDSAYTDFDIKNVDFFGRINTTFLTTNPLYYKNDLTSLVIEPVKSHIMTHGAVASSIYIPKGFDNTNQQFVYNNVDVNNAAAMENFMNNNEGHAIIIIGWDDNYGDINNDGIGDGAWIVQNSWGDIKSYFYVSYYDTQISTDMFGISLVENKEYDFIYNDPYEYSENGDNSTTFKYYVGYVGEKVEGIKLYGLYETARNLSIEIKADNNASTCKSKETKEFDFGMVYFTFDNCEIEGEVSVTVKNSALVNLSYDSLNISMTTIDSDDILAGGVKYMSNFGYAGNGLISDYMMKNESQSEIDLYIASKNILTGVDYTIKVLDNEENDISSNYVIDRSEQINGIAYARLKLKNPVNYKKATVKVIHDSNTDTTRDINPYTIGGNGTSSSPYIIKIPEDMYATVGSRAHFILNNSLDLGPITSSSEGEYKIIDEAEWYSESFKGVFDGNGYSLNNIHLSEHTLFGILKDATIKNLKLNDISISGLLSSEGVLFYALYDSIVDNIELNRIDIRNKFITSILGGSVIGNSIIRNVKIKDSISSASFYGSGLIDAIASHDGNEVIIENNYIENTEIYAGVENGGSYFVNEIYMYYTENNADSNIIIRNNKYLEKSRAGEYEYKAANNVGRIGAESLTEGYELNEEGLENLTESIISVTNSGLISSEESIIESNYNGFDFVNVWIKDENGTPRLKVFDVPSTVANPGINVSSYTKSGAYILNVPTGISASALSNNITKSNNDLVVNYYDKNGEIIKDNSSIMGTGSLIMVSNGYDVLTYRIVVKGDNNGDGEVNILDFRRIANYLISSEEELSDILPHEVYEKAANVNDDELINILDFRKVANYLLSGTF